MLSKKMEKVLNAQINEELFSSYIYLSMSAWFETQNLPGFAHWMFVQYQEEIKHALKFFKYLIDKNTQVVLEAIKKPQTDWKNPVLAFEEALKHEKYITKKIHELVTLAKAEKDYATESMLKWFVDEQVEEERNATNVLAKLQALGDSRSGLLMLDGEMGKR